MLHIHGSAPAIRLSDTGANGSAVSIIEDNNGLLKLRNDVGNAGTGSGIAFEVDASERARLDSSGTLKIGGTANLGSQLLQIHGDDENTADIIIANSTASTGESSKITFAPANSVTGARIQCVAEEDFSVGANRTARLEFYTRKDGTLHERMRITPSGRLNLGNSPGTNANADLSGSGNKLYITFGSSFGQNVIATNVGAYTGTYSHLVFYNGNGLVGTINTSGSSTSFNTSSDYRLKENVVDLDGAITRVKQLQPRRFNFIADAETTVDGFIAHEAQTVVPEAVTGTHNEVDDDGNAVMQGIDQSKLVPLLTAALQEAIAKIETLETKVAALEAG